MSDQGDFRGSHEEKRKEETVMLSAGQLGDMMAAAKSESVPDTVASSPAPVSPVAKAEAGSKTTVIIAVAAVAVVVILLVLYLAFK